MTDARAARYGAFGEIGQTPDAAMSPEERKVFRAVGKAHLRTNLPIYTHNAYGTGPNVPKDAGLRQLDAFESAGADPRRIAIGHTCCLDDPTADIIKQLGRRGSFVGFDRVTAGAAGRQEGRDDPGVSRGRVCGPAAAVVGLQLHGAKRGAPGYGSTLTVFVPKLRRREGRHDRHHHRQSAALLAFVSKK